MLLTIHSSCKVIHEMKSSAQAHHCQYHTFICVSAVLFQSELACELTDLNFKVATAVGGGCDWKGLLKIVNAKLTDERSVDPPMANVVNRY